MAPETPRAAPIAVRPAQLGDAEAIREIYNLEVLESTVTFDLEPRTAEDQRAWLTERSGAHVVLVATADDQPGEIMGFASLSPYRTRAGYRSTVETSVYVHRDHRGRGVGRTLMAELCATAGAHGFHAVMAHIVAGHDASVALHEAFGFAHVGLEREVGRKFGRWLDVVVMQLLLEQPQADRRPPVIDP